MKKNQMRIGESTRSSIEEEEEEEEEVKKLEQEVIEMAKRVESYRSTLPLHLKSSLSSLLSLQRPAFSLPEQSGLSGGGPNTTGPGFGRDNSSTSTDLETDDDEQNPDEIKLLRDKISNNISAIPKVLKRMNECISRIDKLDSSNETIHPLFKRKKS